MEEHAPQGAPEHPLAGPILSRFLAGPAGGLIAQLDPDGAVLRATPRLSARMTTDGLVPLADLLTDRSARRWLGLIDKLEPGGPARVVSLRFRGEGPLVLLRCLVHREPDRDLWLLAMPGIGANATTAQELAVLKRRADRRDHMNRLVERARQEARTDPLTRLANRRQGARWLLEEVDRHRNDAKPLCCVVLDLDAFKAINDTLGHPAGDRVLRVASRILSEEIRPLDRIFRYGGEEFVVLLPGTDLDGGVAVADRLRVTLRSRPIRPLVGPLSASFGVACLRPGESAASLFKRADCALIRAKQRGRDRVEADP